MTLSVKVVEVLLQMVGDLASDQCILWGALYSAGYIVRVPAVVRVKSLGTTWTPQ